MGFFDDFTNALETYPETGVQLEIVEVSFPDSVLNVEETATFRVKVTNTGPLNLTDVSLRIKGLNGATVANNGAAAPFVSEFVTQTIGNANPDHIFDGHSDPLDTVRANFAAEVVPK